jgi:hypothetical protein
VVKVGDELAEAQVVLCEPIGLTLQRLGEPCQLLVGRQEPLAHHGRGRNREVDRPEQTLVQLRLLLGQLVGRSGREPHEVNVAELGDDRADHIAPKGGEVMALVQHQGPHPELPQRLHPSAGGRLQEVSQLDTGVLPPRDLALDRCLDPGDLPRPPPRRLAPPGRRLPPDLGGRDAHSQGTVGDPTPLGGVAQRHVRILDLAERLVSQAGDRGVRIWCGDAIGRAEQLGRFQPLRLHGRVRAEHQRSRAQAADDLHPQHGLARARWSKYVGGAPAGLPIPLERLQCELLIAPPAALEGKRRQHAFLGHPGWDRRSHHQHTTPSNPKSVHCRIWAPVRRRLRSAILSSLPPVGEAGAHPRPTGRALRRGGPGAVAGAAILGSSTLSPRAAARTEPTTWSTPAVLCT